MAQNTDCVFCKIAQGEIPAIKLDEDEHTFTFMDINPATDGHALIIPKQHFQDLADIDSQTLALVHHKSQHISQAIMQALQPGGMRVMQFNGVTAGQTVFHYHLHLRPAYAGQSRRSHGDGPGDMEKIKQLADKIRAAL